MKALLIGRGVTRLRPGKALPLSIGGALSEDPDSRQQREGKGSLEAGTLPIPGQAKGLKVPGPEKGMKDAPPREQEVIHLPQGSGETGPVDPHQQIDGQGETDRKLVPVREVGLSTILQPAAVVVKGFPVRLLHGATDPSAHRREREDLIVRPPQGPIHLEE